MEGQEKLSVVSESHRQMLQLELFPRSQDLGFPIIATCQLLRTEMQLPDDLVEGSIINVTLVYVVSSPTGVPKQ